uniref:Little elongation complex subunit 2 C-terminal domain-containing protein n=1 Tax=Plectus sambesii TaxID=2011161 RepID=A0A914WLH0_9BILA
MDIISDIPEMPDCILETSSDIFEVLAHSWTNCTKCLYEHARKMSNNQEILFDDHKPFWVIEREQKEAELAAIQQQEAERNKAEEAERIKQLAAEQAAMNESSNEQKKKKRKKKGKKADEDDSSAAPSTAEPQPSTPAKHVCYTKMTMPARHFAIQQLIKSGKAKSKNEAKWQLIQQCGDQCKKAEEVEVVDKDKVPMNKMPWVSQFNYPKRVSTLTKNLHKRYVAIKLNQAKGGAGRFGHQGSEIHEMDEKLRQERVEFNKFVLSWMQKKATRYEHLPGAALRFLVNRTKALLEQLYGVYSSRPLCQIPFATVDVLNVPLWWPRIVTPLVELGTPRTLILPNLNRKALFDVSVNGLLTEYPHDTASVTSVESDETASKLARKHGAGFVMSAATARLLLLQVPFNRPPHWDIPIIVKKEFVQGRMQSVIYFCKPLPVDGCNAMQQWWRYVKMAVKRNFVHGYRTDSSVNEPDNQDDNFGDDEIFSDSTAAQALDKLETFGVSSPKRKSTSSEKSAIPAEKEKQENPLEQSGAPTSRSPSPDLPPSSGARIPKRRTRAQVRAAKVARLEPDNVAEDSADSDTEQRLTIDVDEEDEKNATEREAEKAVEPSSAANSSKSAATAEPSADASTDLLGSIFSKMPKPLAKAAKAADRGDLQFVEDPAEYDVPDNLSSVRRYVLAQINNCGPILIRSNVDGLVDNAPISFAPKIEYAPEHGAEVISDDEWLWHWATALLKGSKQHLIVSVHFSDAHCLQIETTRAADWSEAKLSDERKYLIASRSKYMADLLARVSQLDDGDYLLQRRADKDHIAIVQKVDHLLKYGLRFELLTVY